MGVRWGSVRSPLGFLGSLGSPLGVLGTSRGPRVELEGLLVGLLVAQLSRGAYPAQARVRRSRRVQRAQPQVLHRLSVCGGRSATPLAAVPSGDRVVGRSR